jgi:sarcosine oxidase subunit beta
VPERASVLVVGGGIIGTSIACALTQRGVRDVRVIDLDLAGIYAASELNAGGARATWWQPVNIETCKATLGFFREHAQELGFRAAGYLWLYDDRELWRRALAKRSLQNRYGLGVEALEPGELARRVPLLDRAQGELVGATWSPYDGLVNPNAVRQWYRASAEAGGARFLNRHYAAGVVTARVAGAGGSLRRVQAVEVVEVARHGVLEDATCLREILVTHRVPAAQQVGETRIECETIVNCLGAWSPVFAAKIGIADASEPVRRQISLCDVHREDVAPGVELDSLGMIVDASGLYFHPEGGHVLAGYSIPSESPGFDFDYDGDAFFETEIWPRLAHRASSFERCAHLRGWAGLYAVTPDRSGIAGRVDGFANLFEAHSFTGRGVMQSWAVGQAMAELIAEGRYGALDLSPLTRRRFADPEQWVEEELHI